MRSRASALLAKYGKSITYNHISEGSYDPSTGDVSGKTTVTEVLKGLVVNYELAQIDGTTVLSGDRKITFADADLSSAPSPGDTAVLDNEVWSVVSALGTYAGERTALWEVQVRR
jgi:hypothetical protein